MAILMMLAGLGLACVAVVYFMILLPNKKKKEAWANHALPAAVAAGAQPVPGRYGFDGMRVETTNGPIGIYVNAGLAVESTLINRRFYLSDGSAYYANVLFQHADMPRFEVTANSIQERFKDGEMGELGNFFNVIADDAAVCNHLWTEEARELMHRSGLEWSILCGGNQIQAVRYGSPESVSEMADIIRIVEILSERATAKPVRAAA